MAQIIIETKRGRKHTINTRETLTRNECRYVRARLDLNDFVRTFDVFATSLSERQQWGDCQDYRTR